MYDSIISFRRKQNKMLRIPTVIKYLPANSVVQIPFMFSNTQLNYFID